MCPSLPPSLPACSAAAVLADHSSQGFEDVLQRIQSKELIASVAFLLAAVDGPGALPSMSRGGLKRSPRAVEAARQQQVGGWVDGQG